MRGRLVASLTVNLPSLKVLGPKWGKIELCKVAKIYAQTFVWWGKVCVPHHTINVWKILQFWWILSCCIVSNRSLSNLAIVLTERHSFQQIFLNLPMSKVESREKTCLFVICFSLFVEPITSQLNSPIRSITSFNLKIPL